MPVNISAEIAMHHGNLTMFQGFEWYVPANNLEIVRDPKSGVLKDRYISHWQRLASLLPRLKSLGITSIWIPPACKATNPKDNGYGIYDLYDLGEFNTKGSVGTKWGTKAELQMLCTEAEKLGIGIIFDAVLNHRAAADESETALALRVDSKNRTINLDKKPINIESWTRFNYGARAGKYSPLKYNKDHFTGVDWDSKTKQKAIYKLVGTRSDGSKKDWAKDVAKSENGNYDYLMFVDVDHHNLEVQRDIKQWGEWLLAELPGVRGMRLDAIKHYSTKFQQAFVKHVKTRADRLGGNFFFVGEYWLDDSKFLSKYMTQFGGALHLFDVRLMLNFHNTSTGKIRDLRKVLWGTLVELEPTKAVTFVTNHDTQECQSLAAPVEPWFIPHAYALILLRKDGLPCVFWGDVFGTAGPRARLPACGGRLVRLIKARERFAYGDQEDYFPSSILMRRYLSKMKDPSCIAWQRKWQHPEQGHMSLVVLLSIGWSWNKRRVMVGEACAGQIFTDIMGWCWNGVQIDSDGYGDFPVGPRSISVWTRADLPGRQEIDSLVYPEEPPIEIEREGVYEHEANAEMDLEKP